MLQIVVMILGIVYVFKLAGLNKAAANLALSPEALAEWKDSRTRQYVWGIVAGWGSFVLSYIVLKATLDPNGYYNESDLLAAEVPGLLVGLTVLIVGLVFSVRAGTRAKNIEQQVIDAPPGYPQLNAPG